jgi:CSLREA domain-containing protein
LGDLISLLRNDHGAGHRSEQHVGQTEVSGKGGAVYAESGSTTIMDSTFYNNRVTGTGGTGGAVSQAANPLTITNSTFSNNSATGNGGGIYVGTSVSGGDCAHNSGSIGTNTNNLVEDGSCSATLSGDPSLDSLKDNGGTTQTFALLTGSSAIDAGDNTTCSASPVNGLDQRGVTRPQGTQCDIGSYEYKVPLIVTTTADPGDGTCDATCSLHDAISAANADGAADTILFDAALSGATIYLSSTLDIFQSVTIDGSSLATLVTISGDSNTDSDPDGDVRVFYVGSAGTLTLNSLIVTKGWSGVGGGGLLNDGTVTIINSVFSANTVDNNPDGAIINNVNGTLTITGSTFSGNTAYNGGAIGNFNQLTITNSTFSGNGNSGTDGGGAIYTDGSSPTLTQTITNSTFSGNSANYGAAIWSSRSQTIMNSTFSGNSAAAVGGRAIWQDAET